jgi:hypothetical protein
VAVTPCGLPRAVIFFQVGCSRCCAFQDRARARVRPGLAAPEPGADRGPVPVGLCGLHQRGPDPFRAPALVIEPRLVRAPLEYSLGTSPANPMNARALGNRRQATTSAASVSAVSSAIPR